MTDRPTALVDRMGGGRATTLVRALRRETDPLFRQAGLNLDDER